MLLRFRDGRQAVDEAHGMHEVAEDQVAMELAVAHVPLRNLLPQPFDRRLLQAWRVPSARRAAPLAERRHAAIPASRARQRQARAQEASLPSLAGVPSPRGTRRWM